MRKCKNCFIGVEISEYEGDFPIYENEFSYCDLNYLLLFNFCPFCGNKVNPIYERFLK